MSLKRADYTDPANAPFGKRQVKYPTPNRQDLVVIENVPIAPDKYEPLPYHSPHPDYENNGLILVWQGPVKAANNQVKVLRVYANDEGNEDWYNFSVHYSGDVSTAPIHVRSYVVLREDYAADTRGQPLKKIIRLRVTAEGTGLTKASTATISGGGGSGGACTPIIAGGKLIGLELTDAGDSYETNPTIVFGGPGTGATAVAEIQPQTMLLVKEDTAKLDAEDPQLASLFIKVTKVYETLPGPWQYTDSYVEERGTVQRATRPILATGSEEGSFERSGLGPILATKTSYEPRGESAIVLIEIVETWIEVSRDDQVVTSEFGGGILDETERRGEPGSLVPETGFLVESSGNKTISPHEQVQTTRKLSPDSTTPVLELVLQGAGFSTAPAVGFSGGTGTPATAHSILGFGIASIAVNNAGSGYYSPPTVGFAGGGGGGAFATAALGYTVAECLMTNRGSGYTSTPGVTINGDGTGATATAVRGFGVDSIDVDDPGTGYSGIPEVIITGNGDGALANAIMGHPLATIAVGAGGSGFSTPPTVVITGDGEDAEGTAVLGFDLASVAIDAPGSGYDLDVAPSVIFAGGGGSGATATAIMGNPLNAINMNNPGSGYVTAPSVIIEAGDELEAATAVAVLTQGVQSIGVATGGTGYTVPPAVIIDPPETGGVQAEAHAVLTGDVVTSIVIDINGDGYESVPNVSFSGGDGSGATTDVAVLDGGEGIRVDLTDPGAGYTHTPGITFGAGSAIAEADLDVSVSQLVRIDIVDPGEGYTSAPTVTLSDGTGFDGTVSLASTGSVKSVTLTDPGTAYTEVPTISFTGGGGTGAIATATLDGETFNLNRIDMVAAGHGYTTDPTITLSEGSGYDFDVDLETAGEIVSITVTAPGTGYTAATVSFTGGAGSGAAAEVLLSLTGSVKSITVQNAGLFKTLPSIVFAGGGGGTGAVATGTLASTGSVVELVLDTPGDYSVAPTVTFTGSHTIAATALYHIGDALWPTLFGYDTDPVEGIVVNQYRTVVPAGTVHPGRGYFVDLKVHDKWKSIQITSRVDLNTLPLPEVYKTSRSFHLPPTLESIEAIWSDVASKLAQALADRAHVSVSSGSSGGIIVRRTGGFHGYADAWIERIFFFGPPPASAIPPKVNIVGSSGSAVLTQFNASTQYTKLDDGGQSIGDDNSTRVADIDINDHLVGNFGILNSSHLSPARNAIALSGGGSFAQAVAYGKLSYLTVDIDPSEPRPEQLRSGRIIVYYSEPQKWRFGVWILETVRIVLP